MGLVDKLRGAWSGFGLGHKKLDPNIWATARVVMGQGNVNFQTSSQLWRSFTTEEKQLVMHDCVTVFACVWQIMNSATKATPRIGREVDGEWTDTPNHPYKELLKHPNPAMSGHAFMQRIVAHLEIAGRCHIWKWRAPNGEVKELWPFPPSWVKPMVAENIQQGDDRRLVDWYDIEIPGGASFKNIPPEDMITMTYADPFSMTAVLPPLQAAMRAVQLHTRGEDYEIETVGNLRPTPCIRTLDDLSEPQKKSLKAMVQSFMGWDNSRTAMTISGEEVGVEILDALKGKDWHLFRSLRDVDICAAFRVPPILALVLVGLENSPWSNVGEARGAFYSDKMVPLWRMLEDGLTAGLFRSEGDVQSEVWYDTNEITEMQESQDAVATRMNAAWSAGAITRNEYRQALGFDPDDARGEFYIMPMGVTEVPANEKPEEPEPILPPGADAHASGAEQDMGGGDMMPQDGKTPPAKGYNPKQPRARLSGQFADGSGHEPAEFKVDLLPPAEVQTPEDPEDEDDEAEPEDKPCQDASTTA